MSKYRIILEGDVQQIGFREQIKRIAIKMKIKGAVRNLDDGTVEIYSDLSEEQLETLKNAVLNVKLPAPLLINIENIKIMREDDKDFGTPPCDFSKFKVIRDENEVAETLSVMTSAGLSMQSTLTQGFKDLGDKIDGVGNKMDGLGNKMDGLGNKVDGLGSKIDGLGNSLGDKVDSMHTDMNTRFDTLDEKYGTMGQSMVKFLEQQQEHNKKLDEILEILSKGFRQGKKN